MADDQNDNNPREQGRHCLVPPVHKCISKLPYSTDSHFHPLSVDKYNIYKYEKYSRKIHYNCIINVNIKKIKIIHVSSIIKLNQGPFDMSDQINSYPWIALVIIYENKINITVHSFFPQILLKPLRKFGAIFCKEICTGWLGQKYFKNFGPFGRAELVVSLSITLHRLDYPRVQEEKNQDWHDSWKRWFIRNSIRFNFSPLLVLKDCKGLTYNSGVGDKDDHRVYWVCPQTSVLHCRHLPDHWACDI